MSTASLVTQQTLPYDMIGSIEWASGGPALGGTESALQLVSTFALIFQAFKRERGLTPFFIRGNEGHLTLVGMVSKGQSWNENPESLDYHPKTSIITHYKLIPSNNRNSLSRSPVGQKFKFKVLAELASLKKIRGTHLCLYWILLTTISGRVVRGNIPLLEAASCPFSRSIHLMRHFLSLLGHQSYRIRVFLTTSTLFNYIYEDPIF